MLFRVTPQTGSPMTYMHKGKQYIVVAVGRGNIAGEYLAFSLPDAPARPTTGGQ